MRFLGTCVLWALGAAACAVLVILIYEAYLLAQSGGTLSADSLPRLTDGVLDHLDYVTYAAMAGLLLGIVSAIPSFIRQNAERLIGWSLFGAVSGAFSIGCLVFLYKGFVLHQAGVSADRFSLLELLAREMRIQDFLPYGAIAGAAVALFMITNALLRENAADRIESGAPGYGTDDPDTVIRMRRARRAQQYLAERGQKDSRIE